MSAAGDDHRTVEKLLIDAGKLRRRSKLAESLELLKRAYALDRTNYAAIANIAEILALGSASSEAITWSKKAMVLAPARPQAYNWLQRATSRAVLPETQKFGAWSIAVSPGNPLAHYFLGTFLRNSGRPEDSWRYFKASATLLPVFGELYFHYARMLHSRDDPSAGLKNYNRAKVLNFKHSSLDGEIEAARTATDVRRTSARVKIRRWPKNSDAFKDIEKLLYGCLPNPKPWASPPLDKNSTVFTLGSCFAQNIAQILNQQNLPTTHLPLAENFNTTAANLTVLRWILKDHTDSNIESVGEIIPPERKQYFKRFLMNCDTLVYTMGVSPTFFDRASGDHVIPKGDADALAMIRKHEFRTTTVSENVENLNAIIELTREINAEAHIVLSVSPIPLSATFEMDSAIIADCVSKSIMRAAVHEIQARNIPNLSYWPSFEMVKWVAPHRGKTFGDDDGSSLHVNREILSIIFECFVDYYSDGAISTTTTDRDAFSNTKFRYSMT